MADLEIIDLYQKARAAKPIETLKELGSGEGEEFDIGPDLYVIVGAVILAIGLLVCGFKGALSVLFALTLILVPLCYVLGHAVGTQVVGPIGLWKAISLKNARSRKKADPNDPEVLAAVIEYISETPITRANELRASIAGQRAQLSATIQDLPLLIDSFAEESRVSGVRELSLILDSRRGAAVRALARLQEVEMELAEQDRQADEAVPTSHSHQAAV